MNLSTKTLFPVRLLRPLLLLAALVTGLSSSAVTLWTNTPINFVQSAAQPVDVIIPGSISLTRGATQWLYNTNFDTKANDGTPSKTKWAFGLITNHLTLDYKTFDAFRNGDLEGVLTNGDPMVLRLQLTTNFNEDILLQVSFSTWPHGGGFFAYTRTTAPIVAPPSPTITLTNPLAGAVFAAPANVKIEVNASVSGGGSVTNVQFFAGTTSLGSDQTAPFSIIASNLPATNHVLTAIATAGGATTVSSPINITVVAPVATILSSPQVAGGQFSFDYTANPGLRYVIQNSSNFTNWLPLATNVATTNPVHFNHTYNPADSPFYRVGRLPNP